MQIHTSGPLPGVAHLSLDGRLTLVSAPQLRTAITEAVDSGRSRVVVDLTEVGFMDSSGWAPSSPASRRPAREAATCG